MKCRVLFKAISCAMPLALVLPLGSRVGLTPDSILNANHFVSASPAHFTNASQSPDTFYLNEQDYFTIAVLPDTQYYSEHYPEIFTAQTQWLADNAAAQNIVFVAHVGDLVQDSGQQSQWQNAKSSLSVLRSAGIPYSVVPGNHDLNGDKGDARNFNKYFPPGDFYGYPWYGGNYPPGSNINSFELFKAGGQKLLILNLVCSPPLLAQASYWANTVLSQHEECLAIVVTHGYVDEYGEYSEDVEVSGTSIWKNIVRLHQNIIAVICGHEPGESHQSVGGLFGNSIENLLFDPQEEHNPFTPEGGCGNGWLRLYRFYPEANRVLAFTYSPYLNQFDRSASGQFRFEIFSTTRSIPRTYSDLSTPAESSPFSLSLQ